MKLFWTLQLGICAASFALLTAYGCGGNVVVDTPTGTDTSGTDTSTENELWSGTECISEPGSDTEIVTVSETDTVPVDSCACACTILMSQGGCADICSELLNGTSTPNYCEGMAPLSMCAVCVESNCPGLPLSAGTCLGQ